MIPINIWVLIIATSVNFGLGSAKHRYRLVNVFCTILGVTVIFYKIVHQ
jgi:hypothetical protein